jgi:hypothetical protein
MLERMNIAFHDDLNAAPYVVLVLTDIDPDSGVPEDILLSFLDVVEVSEEERRPLGSLAVVLTQQLSSQAGSAELLSAKASFSPQLTVRVVEADGYFQLSCETAQLVERGAEETDDDAMSESFPLEALDGFQGTRAELYQELQNLLAS